MRAILVVPAAVAAAVSLAGCGGTTTATTTVTVPTPVPVTLGAPERWQAFGHIASLKPAGRAYALRFDPALLLSGDTAHAAAVEDGVVSATEAIPNDNYRVDESHRLYAYTVPADARVTVITNTGQLASTPISVAALAKVVAGTSTKRLFEPLDTGVWITIRGDRVLAIDQQYEP